MSLHLPESLLAAAGLNTSDPSAGAARLLALELFREEIISLGRAAELSETPVEDFLEFANLRNVPLHYGLEELEEDRATAQHLLP